MIRGFIYVSACIYLLALIGCEELYVQDNPESYYAVESYLIANDSLPEIRLTETIPIHDNFDKDKMAIRDANISIRLLTPDSSVAESYHYQHHGQGRYLPADEAVVKPLQWYQLYITLDNGETVTAKTFVPGTFNIVKTPKDRYKYRENSQIEFVTTSSHYPGRQTYYLFTVKALNTSEHNLTPIYKELVQKKNAWINSYFLNSSDVNNESKYKTDDEGNIRITIPWSIIAFYGQNVITVNALDDNLYNYVRSQDGFTEGTTWANGKVQNTRYNITGGIGIFGSMARIEKQVNITEAE